MVLAVGLIRLVQCQFQRFAMITLNLVHCCSVENNTIPMHHCNSRTVHRRPAWGPIPVSDKCLCPGFWWGSRELEANVIERRPACSVVSRISDFVFDDT